MNNSYVMNSERDPHSKMTSQGHLTDLLAGYRDVRRTSCTSPVYIHGTYSYN